MTIPVIDRLSEPVHRVASRPPARTADIPALLVLDTCVLLSNVLRRVFLRLATEGHCIPVWSERIGEEWRRNAARIWKVDADDVGRQWADLQDAHPQANQGDVSQYEAGLHRSDPKDWHVIAAGRAAKGRHPGQRAAIVTRNTRDFNRTELRGYGMALFEPDELLLKYHLAHPDALRRIMPDIPRWAVGPGKEPDTLEAVLKRERLFRLNRLYRGAI